MVFCSLSQRSFDSNFKNNEATGFIISGLFFHMSVNIAAKILFISWILLKILRLTAVTNTRFHGNFLSFALLWYKILYFHLLRGNASNYDWLELTMEFPKKKASLESKRVTFLFLLEFPKKLARILNRKGFDYS